MRVVGATAIALAASMAIQNAPLADRTSRLRGPDRGGAHLARGEPVTVAIAVGLEALHLPLLLGFVTGLHGLVGRRGCADWSRLAVAAGATLGGLRALRRPVDRVVLSAGDLAEPSPAFELAWQLHAAAFALALPALGTFIGAALAAHMSRLTPPWQRLLGVAGEACCSPPERPASAIADGSAPCSWGCPAFRLARVAACDRRTAGALEQPTVLTTRIDLRRGG